MIRASQNPMRASVFDLECCRNVGGREAVHAPGGVGAERRGPGNGLREWRPDLAGRVDVKLLQHLRDEKTRPLDPQLAHDGLCNLVLAGPASTSCA